MQGTAFEQNIHWFRWKKCAVMIIAKTTTTTTKKLRTYQFFLTGLAWDIYDGTRPEVRL